MIHITASGAQDIVNDCDAIRIAVGLGFTGTLTVSTALGGTALIATNPATGQEYNVGGLTRQGKVTVNPSATTDLAVTVDPTS